MPGRWPYGFGGQEALYVLFRSLLLIGMLSVAVVAALRELATWFAGGGLPEAVELAPVGAYTLLTVVLCLLLAQEGAGRPVRLLDFSLQKQGRTTFLVAWLDPLQPVDGAWMDTLRQRLEANLGELLTRQAPFATDEHPSLPRPAANS
jgi:predicted Co/Zn/Cd cation transporter (cation efflux family)